VDPLQHTNTPLRLFCAFCGFFAKLHSLRGTT
jgi:hypothetical protein